MDKTWVKILFTLWPIIIIILSLLFLKELPWFTVILALGPSWWFAVVRKMLK